MGGKNIRCYQCEGTMEKVILERYTLTTPEKGIVVFEHVPAEKCPKCGQITFSLQTIKKIELSLSREKPTRQIKVPVYPLEKMAAYV
ncbi:YgiT-type zinc finger protein [bacterium]|nr:YgiT-type zinc finger protein [bacterium]